MKDEGEDQRVHDGPSPHGDDPEEGSTSQDRPGSADDPEAGTQDAEGTRDMPQDPES